MRSRLSPLYDFCGALAALFMFITLAIILVNIMGRELGFFFPGADAYTGYSIAAIAFLALAPTFRRGEHIRVTLVIQRLRGKSRHILEMFCLVAGSLLAGYFSFFSWRLAWYSYILNDISPGQDATPMWIPQLAMAIGASVFTLALLEELISQWRNPSERHMTSGDMTGGQ